ncbi:MAG TPA: hypothetical protein PK668_18770 [Myxococcota bacterium]|nr:hypothetical protein [Myxococcota bacterium]HRY96596.1 hypothetical protein [Myxococcota bacterium]
MYAKARQGELTDLSSQQVSLVKCASEFNYRVLMSKKDPWVEPDPRTFPKLDQLAQILLTAPAPLLPDC